MEKLRHYLINMPDRSTRQTLCIMPQTKESLLPFATSRTGTSGSSMGSIVWRPVKPCKTWMSPRALGSSSRYGTASLGGLGVRRSCVRSQHITITSIILVVSSRPDQPTFLQLGSSRQSWDPLFPRFIWIELFHDS